MRAGGDPGQPLFQVIDSALDSRLCGNDGRIAFGLVENPNRPELLPSPLVGEGGAEGDG